MRREKRIFVSLTPQSHEYVRIAPEAVTVNGTQTRTARSVRPVQAPHRQPEAQAPVSSGMIYLVFLMVIALIIGVYWSVRFGGFSGEGDTARMTQSASAVYAEGQLTTTEAAAYQSGFGFPAILAILSHVTNVPIRDLQLNSGLWLIAFVATAYLCFRELLRNNAAAALSVLLLLLMPDFVFYILRGSHEKVTWMFTLILIYLLVRSYRLKSVRSFAINTIVFYFVFWNFASTHVFFASTLLTAIFISYLVGFVLIRLRGVKPEGYDSSNGTAKTTAPVFPDRLRIGRLALVGLSCFIIVYVVLNYVYPPAQNYYNNLEFVLQRVQSLFIGGGTTNVPAQETGLGALGFTPQLWRSREAYLLITVTQWLIILTSAVSWFVLGWRLLRQSRFTPLMFLWLWYSAMAIQLVLAVVTSYQGVLFFNNLSLRVFTPFALTAVPMATLLIIELIKRIGKLPQPLPALASVAACVVLGFSSIAMLLKVTTDPLVGNFWQFTVPGEISAIDWIESHSENRYVHMDIWTLRREIYELNQPYNWEPNNFYLSGSVESFDEYDFLFVSELTTLQAQRAEAVLPLRDGYNRIYDNGQAQIYERYPNTPYQD